VGKRRGPGLKVGINMEDWPGYAPLVLKSVRGSSDSLRRVTPSL